MENTTFIPGVVYLHGEDEEALLMSAEIEGDDAADFTGERSYEKVILKNDAEDEASDRSS